MAQRHDAIHHRLHPFEHAALGPHEVDLLRCGPSRPLFEVRCVICKASAADWQEAGIPRHLCRLSRLT